MKRKRKIMNHTMKINGTPDAIFPLLCPVREYEWIQPWECEMVYTDSGVAEQDCVFKTNFPDDGAQDTWVVAKYEPTQLIEFVRINPLRSIRYSIELMQQTDGSTHAVWQQVITGLNAEGDDFVAGLKDETYHRKMEMIQKMINYFLKTGEMMKVMV